MKSLLFLAALVPLAIAPTVSAAPPARASGTLEIQSLREVKRDTSRPMREIVAELAADPSTAAPDAPFVPNIIIDARKLGAPDTAVGTPDVQQRLGGVPAPAPIVSFTALSTAGSIPPDTTGDVSPTHFFQWVNTRWALYNKTTGALVSGPTAGSSFWAGFGGLCQTTNRGDPLVLWDDAAQRWIVSQFAFTSTTTGPFLQCIAVSTTSDPLGTYHRYAFQYPVFNDYGKMGIWRSADGGQNAYLLTMHEFQGNSFVGTSFAAVERDRMLAGESARFIRVGGIDAFGALPFHLEGTQPMPAGACPIFGHFAFSGTGYRIWDFCLDWAAGQVLGFSSTPQIVQGAPFVSGTNAVPQRDSTVLLDQFDGNSMYLAVVRAFPPNGPSEQTAALTHSVNAGNGRAGQKWVQFGLRLPERDSNNVFGDGFEPFATPVSLVKRITREGTYAPGGTEFRWMGSINIDQDGNLGLGYNVSGPSLNPEIRISGRLWGDSPTVLRDEQVCIGATGAQTGGVFPPRTTGRWGDYSTTGVDPVDDCTFWHTGEFFATLSTTSWSTRVCSFKFPSCGQPSLRLERIAPTSAVIPVCSTSTADPIVTVRAAVLGGLVGNATLSSSSFPAGVTATPNPGAVPPGGSSAVTLVGARALAPSASYTGVLTATNGALTSSITVPFGVSASAAPVPSLQSPANGTTNALTRPTFTWAAVPGALSYRIEVSAANSFATLVESAETTATSYVPRSLFAVGTQYFWRVRPLNFCGEGTTSATFAFTPSTPGSCPAGATPNTVFIDDVAGDAIAWTTENVSGDAAAAWTKATPPAGTGLTTRAWVAGNSATTADQRLVSPAIVLPAAAQRPLALAYDAHHQYETDGTVDCWDGGFVEISTDGGTNWAPLGNTRTLTDPYPGLLSSGNPASGTEAWCRQPTPGTPIRTVFTLDSFAGQTVRLRFRSTADSNTVGTAPAGWSIDNISVQGCQGP